MSSAWYYMTSGWFRKGRRVGPISESDLLHLIARGSIDPKTLVQSQKTRGRWVPMKTIGPAMEHWIETHPSDKQD